jgi:hypothetical protein
MKSSTGIFLAILLVLAGALSAQEPKPDAQYGNFLFVGPPGWTPVEKDKVLYINAPSPQQGTTTFISLSAADLDGDLDKSFNELWAGFKNSYRILQGGQIISTRSTEGYDVRYTTATAADQAGKQWTLFVLGSPYRTHLQIVIFMSDLPQGTALKANEDVFQKFLASLTLGDALPGAKAAARGVPEATPEVPHKLAAGALEGFYVGMTTGYGGRLNRNPLYFSPDGWVVKIDLNNSMIGFDLTAYRNAKNTNRSWVGRYRTEGNDINILWQDYTEHRELIHRNENSPSPGLNTYVPTCRCTGKRFAGKYLWGLAGSGQYIQFFADGTFTDHGVTDQMLVPNAFYDHPRTQRGTYTIQSQTVVFNFADGHSGTRTFTAPKVQERGPSFDWIGLGVQTLYEEHYRAEP